MQSTKLTKALQQPIYEAYPHCIAQRGPEDIDGVSNFYLPVKASKGDDAVFSIWGLDSNKYLADDNQWYGGDLKKDATLEKGLQGDHDYDFVKFSAAYSRQSSRGATSRESLPDTIT